MALHDRFYIEATSTFTNFTLPGKHPVNTAKWRTGLHSENSIFV